MSFRVHVDWDGVIEITRLDENGKSYHDRYNNFDAANHAIRFLLKRDIELARSERYIPEVVCEGHAILRKQLKEREKKGNHYVTKT
jgi:hypothetical protein